jgi:hypothetical protein
MVEAGASTYNHLFLSKILQIKTSASIMPYCMIEAGALIYNQPFLPKASVFAAER